MRIDIDGELVNAVVFRANVEAFNQSPVVRSNLSVQ